MIKMVLGSLFIKYILALRTHLKNQAQTCLAISLFLRCVNNKTGMQALCLYTLVYFFVMHRSDPALWDTSARWIPLAS